jgi:hypothetical protein
MRFRLSRPITLPLAAAVLALSAASDALEAQAPRRRGNPASIKSAGAAFVAGVAAISDNPSAFTQTVLLNGCEVSITAHRRDKADSLVEMHIFDAGNLSARSPERISLDATTGAIMFRFPTVNAVANVSRARRRFADVASGGSTPPVEEKAQVAELLILAANTSQQFEVVAFQSGWKELLQACGGDPSSAGDPVK